MNRTMKKLVWLFCAALIVLSAAAETAAGAERRLRAASFDGIEVRYLDEGPRDALPVVFIHGWACTGDFWRFQTAALRDRYRVIALDLPGFGESGKPHDRPYTPQLFARAVKAVLDHAGVKRPVLAGHSMGYGVAVQFLADYPGEVRGVCNADGAFFWLPDDPGAVPEWEAEMKGLSDGLAGPDRENLVLRFINATFYGRTPEDLRKEITGVMASADEYAANSSMAEFIRRENWVRRSFDVPSLAVYSKIPELPAETEQKLRETFPDLTYVEWTDTGHFLMMEQPERFNGLLAEFLERMET
ncbi:MAG: alpha/beta hydrolase [Aminivibrio sp.]|uniref:alpha/beta fold hydrolase n=1 Tax=Aminivibrio sp. TaxID=1872489 RepID=UPI002B212231|nr:alpha/beta hydrolase [Aminivibrio sp.]MEA4953844.1 alpha/beta hydrolase [Aminivibrio sp.]